MRVPKTRLLSFIQCHLKFIIRRFMRTNPDGLVAMSTTFLMVVSNIFTHNRCAFLFRTYKSAYQITCTKTKYHITERFIRHSGTLGPRHRIQFASCFMLPFYTKKKTTRGIRVQGSLQNCGRSLWILIFVTFLVPRIWIFVNFMDPCINHTALLTSSHSGFFYEYQKVNKYSLHLSFISQPYITKTEY